MASRLSEVKINIECLPVYDGTNKKHLSTFIKQVDRLMGFLNNLNPVLSDFEKFTVINGIISKIKGKALESLDNSDTTSWNNIKQTLQGQHLIFKTYATIFNEIIYLNKKDPYELFELVNEKAKDFKDLVTHEYPADDHIVTVFEKIIIQNFINKVAEPYGSNLANRQPESLSALGNLLQNDYQFLKYRQPKILYPNNSNNNINNKYNDKRLPNIAPQQFPKSNFPSGPAQINFNAQRRNFAPRQNIINHQQNPKPTPMSTQTSIMQRPSTNNFPNNYFANQNRQFGSQRPNFIFEEVQHQEMLNETDEMLNETNNTNESNFSEQESFLEVGETEETQVK